MNLCRRCLIKQKSESERKLSSILETLLRLGMSHNDPGSFLYQTLRGGTENSYGLKVPTLYEALQERTTRRQTETHTHTHTHLRHDDDTG